MLRRRIILLVPLLALFAFVATTEERAEAADTTPPETTITNSSVSGTTATFDFFSNETSSTFKCKLVGQDSTRTTCTSPKTYTDLTAGTKYTFKVWATDAAGNIDPTPATRTFTPNGGGGGGSAILASAILVGAGDISSGGSKDQETGNLVRAQL